MALKSGENKPVKETQISKAEVKTQQSFGKKPKGENRTFSIRLQEGDIIALTAHFDNKGLKLTQGLRMIIKEYMDQEGI